MTDYSRSVKLTLVAIFVPSIAQAYVGPGAGIGAIMATFAVLLGLVLLIVGFLWYPLKRLLRRRPTQQSDDIPTVRPE